MTIDIDMKIDNDESIDAVLLHSDPYKSHLSLARKYRPRSFADVIGQDRVVRVLTNAISHNAIPPAILLSGTRGIGKTTIARLIAKSLKCDLASNRPIVNFCNQCDQCIAIERSINQDVLEMDAASHTGVNDIKDILSRTMYSPMNGLYQVNIIDEFHMLSTSAFNALLKAIEEPPQYVIFIFATTEINKIPLTILSRCCKLNLLPLNEDVLLPYYRRIMKLEHVEFADKDLAKIARAADGSVRDGLSLLDASIIDRNILDNKEVLHERPLKYLNIENVISDSFSNAISDLLANIMRQNIHGTLQDLNLLFSLCSDGTRIFEQLLDRIADCCRVRNGILQDTEIESALAAALSSIDDEVLLMIWDIGNSSLPVVKNFRGGFKAIEISLLKIIFFIKKKIISKG